MASEKKIEFLVKNGYSREAINTFISYGVDKSIIWFLNMHKSGQIKNFDENEIKLINNFVQNNAIDRKASYKEIVVLAKSFEKNQKRLKNNIIYTFKNGYYVSVLNSIDLTEEGRIMSNCVGGYQSSVECGNVGLLALKNKSGKTIVHIEVKKNGLLGQNYAKANSQMSAENWKMILEFFENNSKDVDLSKMFGESYVLTYSGNNFIDEIIMSIPTSVNISIKEGVKKQEAVDVFEVKRFSFKEKKSKNSVAKLNSKIEMIEWLEKKKKESELFYEEIISQVLATDVSKLYLSDKIKEKIFGKGKDAYLMKGNEYSLNELDIRKYEGNYNDEVVEDEPEEMMNFDGPALEPAHNLARNLDMVFNEPVRRPIRLLNVNQFVEAFEDINAENLENNRDVVIGNEQEIGHPEERVDLLINDFEDKTEEDKLEYEEVAHEGGYGENIPVAFGEAPEEVLEVVPMRLENYAVDMPAMPMEIEMPPESLDSIMERAKQE